ncbi:MAG: hypothetical protein UHU21_04855, partial [Lachnospiraceae bacterium]|nr:hypothetical protein [Lachnospiraceae bacterium]
MGWFDEQIRERMKSDQELMEDSLLQIAGAVMGRRAASRLADNQMVAKEALDDVLKYYHYKSVDVPETIRDVNEQLDYVLRPLGLMTRDVELEEGWYKDAFGPMLGLYLGEDQNSDPEHGSGTDGQTDPEAQPNGTGREDGPDGMEQEPPVKGTMVALIPGMISGYYFCNPETGKKTWINHFNAKLISKDAMCFYRPLPMKSLKIPDLLLYMKDCLSSSDYILIFLATLAMTLVGMVEPKVYQMLTGPVLESKNMSLLVGTAIFLLSAAFASQMLSVVRSLLMNRISSKTSLAVE